MTARVSHAPRRRFGATASLHATLKSRSVSLRSRTRSSAKTWRRPRPPLDSPWRSSPMADPPREIWITGVGIVSTLGEGPQAHWQGLQAPPARADTATWAPFVIHPIAALEFDKQIPKKGDQRQMEPWQRIGTYAAGLALDSAKLKGNAALLGSTDMIVAGGGGERDIKVDATILSGISEAANPAAFLNERLM